MALRNTDGSYGSLSKFFHWLCAAIVIALLVIGSLMSDFSDMFKSTAYTLHKSSGILLMVIMLLRAAWMIINPKPSMPKNSPRWEIFAAHATHYTFYVLLIVMPISGWIMSCAYGYPPKFFGLFVVPFPGITKNIALANIMHTVHFIVAWCLVSLIVIHILAALKHHFIDKDNLLLRMLPGNKP